MNEQEEECEIRLLAPRRVPLAAAQERDAVALLAELLLDAAAKRRELRSASSFGGGFPMALSADPPSDDDYIYSLGLLTITFSLLDTSLHHVAWALIGDKEEGRKATAGITTAHVEKMALDLARQKFGDDAPEFVELNETIERVGHVRRKRNALVHSIWSFAPPDLPSRRWVKQGTFIRTPNVALNDIDSVIAEAHYATTPLVKFVVEAEGWQWPSDEEWKRWVLENRLDRQPTACPKRAPSERVLASLPVTNRHMG